MTVRKTDNITVLKPNTRRLDVTNSSYFFKNIQSIITSGIDKILIDLSEILYIDTRGLSFIIDALHAMDGEGEVSICCPNGRVNDFLKLTKMDNIFRIFPNSNISLSNLSA